MIDVFTSRTNVRDLGQSRSRSHMTVREDLNSHKTVISRDFHDLKYFIVKNCYYDDSKSRNLRITENHDLEMMVSENHD